MILSCITATWGMQASLIFDRKTLVPRRISSLATCLAVIRWFWMRESDFEFRRDQWLVCNGEVTSDQTAVGFVFAKEKIQKQIYHIQCSTSRFEIPPNASHHKVTASRTFSFDATGIGMYSHMHLRGKDMTFEAIPANGDRETLLSVPNYNFEWQSAYRWPTGTMRFRQGTRIDCIAHFDNSSFNPFNPDSQATVRHGLQTYDEMMFGFLFFTRDDEELNLEIDASTGHVVRN
jgi:hypothetical protein